MLIRMEISLRQNNKHLNLQKIVVLYPLLALQALNGEYNFPY